MGLRSLRQKDTQKSYDNFRELHKDKDSFHDWPEKLVKEYKYWRLINNSFPADKVTQKHDLLIPIRIFANCDEMNQSEAEEFLIIKEELSHQYDSIMENFTKARSVRDHSHFHFIIWKENDWEEH